MEQEFDKNYFREKLQHYNVFITDIQIERLFTYAKLLLDENKKVNLISRGDEKNVFFNHLFYSLLYSLFITTRPGLTVLDVGTGGGLPGIPLAIILPSVKFVLIDGVNKKIKSVNFFIKELGLANADAVQIRTEGLVKIKSFLRSFDFVVSRSVSDLSSLVVGAIPFLKRNKDSRLIYLKGGDLNNEVGAAKLKNKQCAVEIKLLDLTPVPEIVNKDKKFVLVSLN